MTLNQFIRKLLRLKDLSVVNFDLASKKRQLHLWVKPYKNGCRCPECQRRGRIVRTMNERSWQDIPICGRSVLFHYRPKEILCRQHGRIQESIPWADAYARVTYRFEHAMLIYCQLMPQKAAARLLQVASSTVSDLLHRCIARLREGHRIRNLKTLGVDEISYCRGHKYATIVYDLDRSRVVWVGQGKGRETIDQFFHEALSAYQKANIKWACCDMSQTYMGAIKEHCPKATLVLDRFHIVKALNAAVDEVRKEQWRQASANERKILKGLRWLLFKHSENRSKKDSRILNRLRTANRKIHRAWVLKDEFEHFWEYAARWAAERFVKNWSTAALKSRLEPIRNFVQTLRAHLEHILPFIDKPITNAKAEGINRVIRLVKNRASGFRNLHALSDMIFLTVGDLDLPAQFPARFQIV